MERVGRSALTRSCVLQSRFHSAPDGRDMSTHALECRFNWPHHIFSTMTSRSSAPISRPRQASRLCIIASKPIESLPAWRRSANFMPLAARLRPQRVCNQSAAVRWTARSSSRSAPKLRRNCRDSLEVCRRQPRSACASRMSPISSSARRRGAHGGRKAPSSKDSPRRRSALAGFRGSRSAAATGTAVPG